MANRPHRQHRHASLVAGIAGIALLSFASRSAHAQPASMPVQGYLTATAGTPVSADDLSITFRVFASATGGTPLHTEVAPVDVVAGRFVHYLGTVAPLDLNSFNGQPLWLEISVSGQVLTPRTPLGTTPYAAFAGGVDWSDIVGVPTGLIDGDSDTTYAFNSPLLLDVGTGQVSLSTAGCSPGEGWLWDGTAWVCEPTAGAPYTAGTGGVVINPATRVVSVDAATCLPGQYSWWTGAVWACENDTRGITTLVAGQGIGVVSNQISIASANCDEDQYSQFRGGAWHCVDDVSTTTTAGPGLRYNPAGELEIASDGCSTGQQSRWNGSVWICETDAGIRTINTSGPGLGAVTAGTTTTLSVAADACDSGEYLTYTADGFECVPDASSAYSGTVQSGIRVDGSVIGIRSDVCAAGQYSTWTAGGWACENDLGIRTLQPGIGIGIAGNIISTAAETCDDPGEYSRWNGSAWVCATDISEEPGEGPGISVVSNVVSINSPHCVDGQYSRWNNNDGVWVCEGDDVGIASVGQGAGVLVAGDGRTVAVDADACPGGYSAYRGGRFVCVVDSTPSYSEGQGIQLTGTAIAVRADNCPSGVSRFNTGTNRFECATDQQGVTSVVAGGGLRITGTVAAPTVGLDGTQCSSDEAWVWTGSGWDCLPPAVAGNGLTRSGRTLSVNLTTACGANEFLRWTGANFACAAIAFPTATVSTTAPILGTGTPGDRIRLDVSGCAEGETWMRRGSAWVCEPAVTANDANGIFRSNTGDLSLSTNGCVDGEVWRRVSGAWSCAPPVSQSGDADANRPVNASASGVVSMSSNGCAANEAWVWSGSQWVCVPTVLQGTNISVSGRTVNLNLPAGCSAGQAARWTGSAWACETIPVRAGGGCTSPTRSVGEQRTIRFEVFMQSNEGANGLWFYSGGPFNSNTAYRANQGTSPNVFGTGAVDVEDRWDACANCGGSRNYTRDYTWNAGQTYRVCAFESFGDGWNGASSYMRVRYNDVYSNNIIINWSDMSNIGMFTANGCPYGGASRETCWYRCATITPEYFSGNGTGNCAPSGETQRIIHGFVDASGSIVTGQGFAVFRRTTGVYEVQFPDNFARTPSVVASQVYTNDHGVGGDTRDNAVLTGISTNRATIITGDSDGDRRDRGFSFIAVGSD